MSKSYKISHLYKKLIFNLKYKINLDNQKFNFDSLDESFNYYGTDKGTKVINPYDKKSKSFIGHGFAEFYEHYLKNFQHKKTNILEIGTWKGSSVASFYHYFKNSRIFCLDRNYKFKFKSKRINFFYCDTRQEEDIKKFEKFLENKNCNSFDLIIDDGSHIFSDILKNFKNFFTKINSGGHYVIEDFNHSKYYPYLNDSENKELNIENILKNLKSKKHFSSKHWSEEFQNFCFQNIEEIKIHKGKMIEDNINISDIVFLKRK